VHVLGLSVIMVSGAPGAPILPCHPPLRLRISLLLSVGAGLLARVCAEELLASNVLPRRRYSKEALKGGSFPNLIDN